MGSCDGAQSMAERSYPTSEVRGRSREDPMPEGRRPRGVTSRLRSGAAAKSARLRQCRNGREELPNQRWRSSIQSTKTRPGADCGSDHELLIAKFRLKLKKVGKTTRPFRYDLNQIPYNYTVEVRNRFKGLDLIERVPDELWMEVRDIVQETGIKTIPMEKK